MTHDYLPKKPAPLPRRKVPSYLKRLFVRSLIALKKLFWFHEEQPGPPNEIFPTDERELSEEQRQQCKEIFDGSRERLSALEVRASSLVYAVVILVPLALAAWGFLWRNSAALSPWLLRAVVVLCLLSLVSALGAVVASFRAGSILPVQWPGPGSLFDLQEGVRREYNAEFDGYGLFSCAWTNHALADHRYDFIRAGQVLVSATLVFLLLAGILLVPFSSAVHSRTSKLSSDDLQTLHETVRRQAEQLSSLETLVQDNRAELALCRSDLALIAAAQKEPHQTPVDATAPDESGGTPQ